MHYRQTAAYCEQFRQVDTKTIFSYSEAETLINSMFFGCIRVIMAALCLFLTCGFYLLSFFFFSSPNLSGCRLDVYHSSAPGVALVRI